MYKVITNATVVLKDYYIPNASILVKNGIICDFGKNIEIPNDAETIDANGLFVGPGLIEIHTHAAGSFEFHKNPKMCEQVLFSHGVTSVLPALYFKMNREQYLEKISVISDAAEKGEFKNFAGFYMEGPYACNVLDKESIEKAHEEIVKDFGTCDILINGAGGNNPKATTDNEYFTPETMGNVKTFFDLDQSGVEFVFNLNFLGTLLPTQVFAKDMLDKEDASIINISSMNAYTPLTKIPAYSGAKAAISNFTQWLAVHFSKTNIRCNAIAPGFFVTKQNEKLLFNDDGTPTARTGKILAATPMDRFGKAEELLGALLFLVHKDASSFVNGVVIPVDGGFSAYSGV